MTNEEYHANTTHISKSGLDLINKSPRHYYGRYLDPKRVRQKPTEAMLLGTAVHAAILEPHLFESDFFVFNDRDKCNEIGGTNPRATNKYKEWKADQLESFTGKTELTPADYLTCLRVRDSVHRHEAAKILLSNGVAEQSIFWNDKDTGAPCKMRPDWISRDTGWIVDPKTTKDASPDGFAKSVYNYRYHVQGSLYMDGYESHFKQQCEGFAFIACETEPPYAVAVYFVTEDIYKYGRTIYKEDLRRYSECLKSGIWEAYGDDFLPLQLPGYAKQFRNQ